MKNKLLPAILLTLAASGCAHRQTPATEPADYAKTIAGAWKCSSRLNEDSQMIIRTVYATDQTSQSFSILSMKMDDNVTWRFVIQSKGTWRIDGKQIGERNTEAPAVRIVQPEKTSERLLQQAWEKSHPEMVRLREQVAENLSKFDPEETVADILVLNRQEFISEAKIEDTGTVRIDCNRIQ